MSPPGGPGDRDHFVDFLRGFSIAMVVFGHWLVSAAYRQDGVLTGGDVLTLLPGWWPLTWVFQVMPVFFFVGGFAHLRGVRSAQRRGAGYTGFVVRRAGRLMVPTGVFLVVGLAAALGAAGVDRPEVRTAARAVTLPLWFLGVYLLVAVAAPAMVWAHERWAGRVAAGLVAATLLADAARFWLGIDAAGWANYALVWLAFHQFGMLYADGRLSGRSGLLAPLGLAGLVVAVTIGPYSPSMVDFQGTEVRNLDPPTAAILALGLAQIGAAVLVRRRVVARLERSRAGGMVAVLNRAPLTLFLWHLVPLLLVAAALRPLGGLEPYPGEAAWYLLRPAWILAAAVVLVPLAWLFAPFERWSVGRPARPAGGPAGPAAPTAAGAGVALMAFGVLGFGRLGFTGITSGMVRSLLAFEVSARLNVFLLVAGALLVAAASRPGWARPAAALVGAALVVVAGPAAGAMLVNRAAGVILAGIGVLLVAAAGWREQARAGGS